MGTPAQTQNAYAAFDTPEQAEKAARNFVKWVQNLEDGKCEEKLKGDYNIGDIKRQDSFIHFNGYSNRCQNLEWQLENVRDFLKEQEGCAEFNADIVILDPSNSVYWDREQD
jgi:hypothetical protein